MSDPKKIEEVRKLDAVMERLFRSMKAHHAQIMSALTPTQLFVMRFLSRAEQAKSSDIARTAGLSPGAITQVCDELDRMGFIERIRSKTDRRVVYVQLTAQGQATLQEFLARRAEQFSRFLDKFGDAETSELIRLLERMVTVIESEKPNK